MAQNFINAGALKYDEKRRKARDRYKKAVERAGFLKRHEKDQWELLGSLLTTKQLREAEKMIIDQDLKRLNTKHKLEKVKQKHEKRD